MIEPPAASSPGWPRNTAAMSKGDIERRFGSIAEDGDGQIGLANGATIERSASSRQGLSPVKDSTCGDIIRECKPNDREPSCSWSNDAGPAVLSALGKGFAAHC